MNIQDFSKKYSLCEAAVYVSRGAGSLPEEAFYFDEKSKTTHIDEKYFLRRKEFNLRLQRFNQDVYYYLEEFFTVTHIAECVAKQYGVSKSGIAEYMNTRLFSIDGKSIIDNRIGKRERVFFRYGRAILRAIRRENKGLVYLLSKRGKELDIGHLLDLRTERYENERKNL